MSDLRIGVGAAAEEGPDRSKIASECREMKRGVARAGRIRVGAGLEQHRRHVCVPGKRRKGERRIAVGG